MFEISFPNDNIGRQIWTGAPGKRLDDTSTDEIIVGMILVFGRIISGQAK